MVHQVPSQVLDAGELHAVNPEIGGALEVESPVIDEDTFVATALRDAQRQLIHGRLGLIDAAVARTQKQGQTFVERKPPDPALIDLTRLIVERGELETRCGQLIEEIGRPGQFI